jgi:hypothetical protein
VSAEHVFDPEAIAARVAERQQLRAVPDQAPPLTRADTSYITGAGDSRGRPLPTVVETSGEDILDRIERQRAAKAIRSPFGEHARPNRWATDVDEDPERFVAPDLDEMDDDVEPETPAPQPSAPAAAATPPARRSVDPEPAGEQDHDPRCGQPLTGGGAPRGWVLVRIVGSGDPPRRYCSGSCASKGIAHVELGHHRLDRPELDATVTPIRTAPAPLPLGRQRATSLVRTNADQQWRDTLTALGKTPADVRAWCAGRPGLGLPARGPIPQHARDAYLTAHTTGATA